MASHEGGGGGGAVSGRRAPARLARLADQLAPGANAPSGGGARGAWAGAGAGEGAGDESRPGPLLAGEVAVITGAGRGIGAAAARLFAKHGARVVVSDLDGDLASEVARSIQEAGGEALAVVGDVTEPAFPGRLLDAAVGRFGDLTVLIPNAGFTHDGVVHKMGDAQFTSMLDVHLTAPFRLIRAAAPYMRDRAKEEARRLGRARPRCILNVSSTSGVHGNAGQVNYGAAKAGVVGLTKSVAKEWGQFNIRCNCLVFGMIRTRLTGDKEAQGESIRVNGSSVRLGIPGGMGAAVEAMNPLQRVGSPEEAAGAMLLLASPLASYITGQAVEVTGGTHL